MIETLKSFVKSALKRLPFALSQNHGYDLQTKRILRRYLKGDSNCIDVGCHKGEILELMLAASPTGQHQGFEPIPAMAEALRQNFAKHSNCTIQNLALGNEQGTADFNHVVSNPSYSGLKKRAYDRAGEVDETIRVQVERLDDVLPPDHRVDLIKIDVEGGELGVLQGATRILETYKPLVIFEHGLGASEFYGSTPAQVYAVLAKAGLRISLLKDYLAGRAPMSEQEFIRQFDERLNYYFVASPV
ncbi:MAG: FkbM family methyltransferase [Saprospiraceae bacterium]